MNSRKQRQLKRVEKQITKKKIRRDQISTTKISTIPLPVRISIGAVGVALLPASALTQGGLSFGLFLLGILLMLSAGFGFRNTVENILEGLDAIDLVGSFFLDV